MTATRTFDSLNRLTQISSLPSAAAAVTYAYSYNDAQADGSFWNYQYDSLGQVTSGKKYWSDQTPVAGQQFEYAHDDIGNRRVARNGVGSA